MPLSGKLSGRQQHCTAACRGVEVPQSTMTADVLLDRDTRVCGKSKELVTKMFVLA